LAHEFSADPPAAERLDIGARPAERRVDESPTDELPADELPSTPESLEFQPQNSDDQDISSDDDVATPDETPCGQAEAGLRWVLAHWGVETELAGEAIETFQGHLISAPVDLRIRSIPKSNVYLWGILTGSEECWVESSPDIAMRVEVLICNGAVSERTNGGIDRLLTPFCMRTEDQVLLSRGTIAKHGSVERLGTFRAINHSQSSSSKSNSFAEM
jgi:hypothetical protein